MSRSSSESEVDHQEMSQSRYKEEERDEEKYSRRKSASGRHGKGSRASPYYKDDDRRYKKRRSMDRSRSRSRSESPFDDEARYRVQESREDPNPSSCLGVFGLSSFTDEKDLKSVFGQYGSIDNIYIIYDREFGKSKGFGFVYYKNIDDAIEARKATQGLELDGRPIRVDYSLTNRPHPPTPGKYLGKVSHRSFGRRDRYDGGYGGGYSGGYGGGGGGYRRRDGGGYGGGRRGGGRSYQQRSYNRGGDYYDDYDEGYSSRRRRYSSPYSSRY